jgi:hypothetical protein
MGRCSLCILPVKAQEYGNGRRQIRASVLRHSPPRAAVPGCRQPPVGLDAFQADSIKEEWDRCRNYIQKEDSFISKRPPAKRLFLSFSVFSGRVVHAGAEQAWSFLASAAKRQRATMDCRCLSGTIASGSEALKCEEHGERLDYGIHKNAAPNRKIRRCVLRRCRCTQNPGFSLYTPITTRTCTIFPAGAARDAGIDAQPPEARPDAEDDTG